MTIWLWASVAALAAFALLFAFLRPRHSASNVEKRSNGRIALTIPVRLRIGDHVLETTASDVSRGGICLLATIKGSAGQPVELEFTLPAHRGQRNPHMLIHGVVRWKKPKNIGVLFDPRDANRPAVLEWIAARERDAGNIEAADQDAADAAASSRMQ